MYEKIERVKSVAHLYVRKYRCQNGELTTRYYGIFKCKLKGKRRTFPLGTNQICAKEELKIWEAKNVMGEDFDASEKPQAMTVSKWLEKYLELNKSKRSLKTDIGHCKHLNRLLGTLPLSEITRPTTMEYYEKRLAEPIMRNGKTVEGTNIKGSTINREIACLSAAKNLAADKGLCDRMPKIKHAKETPRDRILTDEEYERLLDSLPRWLQRVFTGANEAPLDRGVQLNLTWDNLKDDLIKVIRPKNGVLQRIGISPALREVLDELKAEFHRTANIDSRVFTKDGRPIGAETLRKAFDKAVEDAKIPDFQFRDFRHCARTRWGALGLPYEVAEGGMGHKLPGMHGRYTNLSDDQVRKAFQEMFRLCSDRKQVNAVGPVNY